MTNNTSSNFNSTSEAANTEFSPLRKALLASLHREEEREAREGKISRACESILNKKMLVKDLARLLRGVNLNKLMGDLTHLGYFVKVNGTYMVSSKALGVEFRQERVRRTGNYRFYALPAGKLVIHSLCTNGQLTMKVGFGHQK